MEKLDFGKKLIETREAKGLTQAEVAEMCKIATRTIQRIETGVVKPRTYTIKLISETLGFDFFEASNTGYDAKIKILDSNSESHNFLWYIKDLFNLKTNAMRKISILSTTTLIIFLSLFAFISESFAQTPSKRSSITIQKNADKSVKRIEVRFTNYLTYDSLVSIKNDIEEYNIKINYKIIEFDEENYLKEISLEAFSDMGSGSFHMPLSDSAKIGGFFVDYSKDAKTKFCIGGCFEKE